jgi:hypothetical protein
MPNLQAAQLTSSLQFTCETILRPWINRQARPEGNAISLGRLTARQHFPGFSIPMAGAITHMGLTLKYHILFITARPRYSKNNFAYYAVKPRNRIKTMQSGKTCLKKEILLYP